MPAAEIAAAVTGLRSALDITKAMIGLRDAEAFRTKSIELQGIILEAISQTIEAHETYATQADHIRALEAEVARLKAWDSEKQDYELKKIGNGAVAYMLKPGKRGTEPPYWLCPNCFVKAQKSFLNPTAAGAGRASIYKCISCGAEPACGDYAPTWHD